MMIFGSSQNLLSGLCLADCDWAGNQAGLKSLEGLQGIYAPAVVLPYTRGPRRLWGLSGLRRARFCPHGQLMRAVLD